MTQGLRSELGTVKFGRLAVPVGIIDPDRNPNHREHDPPTI